MRNKEKQKYYLYYILENSNYNFLYSIRNCKRPEQTKEYKKLQTWLYNNTVYSIGYCIQTYFEDHSSKFIAPNKTYIQIN